MEDLRNFDKTKRKKWLAEELCNLVEKIEKFDYEMSIHGSEKELTIFVENDREFFWECLLPNLPKGFFVKAEKQVGSGPNQFEIKEITTEKPKDKFLDILDSIRYRLRQRRNVLLGKFPTLNHSFDRNYKNYKKGILEDICLEYNHFYNHNLYSDNNYKYLDCLCDIKVELIYYFGNSIESHFEDIYSRLEEKAKDIEKKEKELAERAKALDLLKKHLDLMLIKN